MGSGNLRTEFRVCPRHVTKNSVSYSQVSKIILLTPAIVQVGCDTFTQLFTQHPEVLEYIADFDTMTVEGINIGEALRLVW